MERPAAGWACESVVAVDVVTATGEQVRADAEPASRPLLGGPRRRARVPRHRHPVPPGHLRGTAGDVARHLDVPAGRPRAAARLAARPAADARPTGRAGPGGDPPPVGPAVRGVSHPGTVLLLHTTAMVSSADEAVQLLRRLRLRARWPDASSVMCAGRRRSTRRTGRRPSRAPRATGTRWTARGPTRRPSVLAPLLARMWGELRHRSHSFSIWYGWAPERGLPDMAFSVAGQRVRRDVRDLHDAADDERYRSWVHDRTGQLARHGAGVYLGDTDFTRRQDRFLLRRELPAPAGDPGAVGSGGPFVSYLSAGAEGLNVHG